MTVAEQLTYIVKREDELTRLYVPSWRKSAEDFLLQNPQFGMSTTNARLIFDRRDLIREYVDLGLTFRQKTTKKEAEKFRHLRSTLSDKAYKEEVMKAKKIQRMKTFNNLKYLKRQLNERGEDLSDAQKEMLRVSEMKKLEKDEDVENRRKQGRISIRISE